MRFERFSFGNQDRVTPIRLTTGGGVGDPALWIGPVCLALFGLVMVYSASLFVAEKLYSPDTYFLVRQAMVMVGGIAVMLMGMLIDPSIYRKTAFWMMGILIGVMIAQTFLVPSIKNTRRWLPLPGGFMLQTSELVRTAVIIYVAKLVSDDASIGLRVNKRLAIYLLPVVALAGLTYLQKDLSSAAMIIAMAGLVLFLAGMNATQFWGLVAGGLAAGVLFAMRTPYQRKRLAEFFFSSGTQAGDSYQSFQSILGFGKGGVIGVGLGHSQQKMLFLPEPHTDFIYAIIGEELGLWGTLAVLFSFVFLFVKAVRVLKQESDRFNYLLGTGLIASLIMFAMVHMMVTTGLMPVTGLPLPFISNGGSSLLVSLWSMGVIWNLSRRASNFE